MQKLKYSSGFGVQKLDMNALERELKVKSHLLNETRDIFTRSVSEFGMLQSEVKALRLNEFGVSHSIDNSLRNQFSNDVKLRHLMTFIGDSTVTYSELSTLRADLGRICKEEAAKKELHSERCKELQSTWDKLVTLRTHVSYFRAAIEEATIEDVCVQTRSIRREDHSKLSEYKQRDRSLEYEFSNISDRDKNISLSSTSRVILLQIIREHVRNRDVTKQRLGTYEKDLADLRLKLEKCTSQLLEISDIAQTAATGVSRTLEYALSLRSKIKALTENIHQLEVIYTSAEQELVNTESELSKAVKDLNVLDNQGGDGEEGGGALLDYTGDNRSAGSIEESLKDSNIFLSLKNSNSNAVGLFSWSQLEGEKRIQELHVIHDKSKEKEKESGDHSVTKSSSERYLLNLPKEVPVNYNESKISKSELAVCDFSIDEVCAGRARIQRIKGEDASHYRMRLQKRLSSLMVLLAQIQSEVDMKSILVKDARDELRECEVRRLRLELQVANMASILDSKKQRLESSNNTSGSPVNMSHVVGRSIHADNSLMTPGQLEFSPYATSQYKTKANIKDSSVQVDSYIENEMRSSPRVTASKKASTFRVHTMSDERSDDERRNRAAQVHQYSDYGAEYFASEEEEGGNIIFKQSVDLAKNMSDLEIRIAESQKRYHDTTSKIKTARDVDLEESFENENDDLNVLEKEYMKIAGGSNFVNLLRSEDADEVLSNSQRNRKSHFSDETYIRTSRSNETQITDNHRTVESFGDTIQNSLIDRQGACSTDELATVPSPTNDVRVDKKIGTTVVEEYTKHGHKVKSIFGDVVTDDYFEAKKASKKSASLQVALTPAPATARTPSPQKYTIENRPEFDLYGKISKTHSSVNKKSALSHLMDTRSSAVKLLKSANALKPDKDHETRTITNSASESENIINEYSRTDSTAHTQVDDFSVNDLWEIVRRQQKEIDQVKTLYASALVAQSFEQGSKLGEESPIRESLLFSSDTVSKESFVVRNNEKREGSNYQNEDMMSARSSSSEEYNAGHEGKDALRIFDFSSNQDNRERQTRLKSSQKCATPQEISASISSSDDEVAVRRSPYSKAPLSGSKWVGGGGGTSDDESRNREPISSPFAQTASSRFRSKIPVRVKRYSTHTVNASIEMHASHSISPKKIFQGGSERDVHDDSIQREEISYHQVTSDPIISPTVRVPLKPVQTASSSHSVDDKDIYGVRRSHSGSKRDFGIASVHRSEMWEGEGEGGGESRGSMRDARKSDVSLCSVDSNDYTPSNHSSPEKGASNSAQHDQEFCYSDQSPQQRNNGEDIRQVEGFNDISDIDYLREESRSSCDLSIQLDPDDIEDGSADAQSGCNNMQPPTVVRNRRNRGFAGEVVDSKEELLRHLSTFESKLAALRRNSMSRQGSANFDRNGTLHVLLMHVRHMPETKRMSHSADSYVEVEVVTPPLRDTQVPILRKRSLTKHDTMFPDWRDDEELKFVIPKVEGTSVNVNGSRSQAIYPDMKSYLRDTKLIINLMDAAKSGRSDNVIATGELLLHQILNQVKHSFWVHLKPPPESTNQWFAHKYARSKPKISDLCSIRLDVKVSYNFELYFEYKIKELKQRLSCVSECKDLTVTSSVRNSAKKSTAEILPRQSKVSSPPGRAPADVAVAVAVARRPRPVKRDSLRPVDDSSSKAGDINNSDQAKLTDRKIQSQNNGHQIQQARLAIDTNFTDARSAGAYVPNKDEPLSPPPESADCPSGGYGNGNEEIVQPSAWRHIFRGAGVKIYSDKKDLVHQVKSAGKRKLRPSFY